MDQNWPAQSSEFWPIEKITPYARNSRTHSDEQVAQIAASIREWGWTNPILVDEDGGLIAGHGRLLAARKLGLTQIPTMVAKGWSEAQKKAYVIADNKLALNAGWDLELLAVELGDLQGFDFDLMLTGFSDDELSKLLAEKTDGLTDPDEIPEAPIDPVTKPGDVWLLGKHRLVCGDSTDADTVAKALNGVSPHLMVTDPPYGVEYDPAWREKAGVAASGTAKGKVLNDDKADWREAWALFPGDVAYVWHAGLFAGVVGDKLSTFQDLESETPVILTTSQLLTTGVDAPTCKNVALARVVGSMAEFKQIIGRGTRLREDYGKLWFSILDYTGTATEKFADPAFDGEPADEITTEIDAEGEVVSTDDEQGAQETEPTGEGGPTTLPPDEPDALPRKLYVDGGNVEVVAHLVYDLDSDGKRLTCRKLTDWTGEKVRTLFPTPAAFRAEWAIQDKRSAIIDALAERGIDLVALEVDAGRPEDDPFDLLCHLAWNAPLTTRSERAQRLRAKAPDLFQRQCQRDCTG